MTVETFIHEKRVGLRGLATNLLNVHILVRNFEHQSHYSVYFGLMSFGKIWTFLYL